MFRSSRILVALLLCIRALPSLAEKFDFDVLLNDKLIGRHQINLSIDATGKTIVEGKANYTIKLLGITV